MVYHGIPWYTMVLPLPCALYIPYYQPGLILFLLFARNPQYFITQYFAISCSTPYILYILYYIGLFVFRYCIRCTYSTHSVNPHRQMEMGIIT